MLTRASAELSTGGIDTVSVGDSVVQTLAVHPFLVAPSEIRYTDSARTTARQTVGSALLSRAGRGLRQVSLTGSFGVAQRGLASFLGTGDQRFKRMWHEIVRLQDAVVKDHVRDERLSIGVSAPILQAALRAYDPDRSTFFVNWYDFWHDAAFECHVSSFNFRKSARGGGATGLTSYQMQISEIGPLVMGGIGTMMIRGLFESLTTWDQINEAIRSFTATGLVDGLVAAGSLPVAALSDSVSAFNAQIDSAVQLLNGYRTPLRSVDALRNPSLVSTSTTGEVAAQSADPTNGSTTLQSHLGHAAQVASDALDVEEALLATRPDSTFDSDGGAIWWHALDGEGTLFALDVADRIDTVAGIVDAANFQTVVGSFYGMDRAEYAAFLTGSGTGGRLPALSGTIEHTVRAWDTAQSLERAYGVPFDDVLRLNDLLPDELLTTGRVVQIPQQRPLGPPEPIDGLPTFGSHAGRAAWGADLWVDLRTDEAGRLLICDGGTPGGDGDGAILIQGVDWLCEQFGEDLLRVANEVPEVVRDAMYGRRLAQVLLSDRRISSVDAVETSMGTDTTGQPSLEFAVTVSAINGGSVTAGGV